MNNTLNVFFPWFYKLNVKIHIIYFNNIVIFSVHLNELNLKRSHSVNRQRLRTIYSTTKQDMQFALA